MTMPIEKFLSMVSNGYLIFSGLFSLYLVIKFLPDFSVESIIAGIFAWTIFFLFFSLTGMAVLAAASYILRLIVSLISVAKK